MSSFWLGNILLIGTIVFLVSRCPVSTFVLEEHALRGSGSDTLAYSGCSENQTFDGKGGCIDLLCPGREYRLYFNQTGKCYPPFDKQPCGNLMHFTSSHENFQIGKCECSTLDNPNKRETRPLVHCLQTQQCYYLFDQGPCQKGEWVVGGEGEPRCEKIPCPAKYQTQRFSKSDPLNGIGGPKFIFAFGGNCYSTLEQAFCPEGKLAVFTKDSFQPSCLTEAERDNYYSSSLSGPQNPCSGGQTLNIQTNMCETNTVFV